MAMTSSFSSVRMFYNIIIHVRRSTSIYFSSLRPPPHHSQTSLPPSRLNTAVTFFLLLDNRYHECLQVNAYNMTHNNIGKYLSPISNETKIGTYIYRAVWYNIIKYRYYCSQNLFHRHLHPRVYTVRPLKFRTTRGLREPQNRIISVCLARTLNCFFHLSLARHTRTIRTSSYTFILLLCCCIHIL